MTTKQIIKHIYRDPKDAYYYWEGILRYFAYKRPWLKWLLRWHIVAQYEERKVLAQDCYFAGQCCCECRTPEVFFAGKSCPGGNPRYRDCVSQPQHYPAMKNKKAWYWHKYNQHNGTVAEFK